MSSILAVTDTYLTQKRDRQVWSIGVNPVVFEEPFGDINYVFHADAPSDVIIKEVPGSRTTIGLQITLNQGTDEGWYDVQGVSNEFRSTSYVDMGIGLIQTGKQALVQGKNTITFVRPFGDINYTFDPISNAVGVTIDMNSRTVQSIDVYLAADDPDFQYEVTGVSP